MGAPYYETSEAAERIRRAFGADVLEQAVRARRIDLRPGLMAGLSEPLLTVPQLECALIHRTIGPEEVRAYVGRKEIDPEQARLVQGARINLPVLSQLARQGVTLVINKLDRWFPALGALAYGLTEWLGEEIEVVGVLGFSGKAGPPRHHDHENVFILQLEGSKEWQFLGEPVVPGLRSSAVLEESSPETRLLLNPGDAMFLPAGQRHQCAAEGYSLHLGVLIKHTAAANLADLLAATIKEDPVLRTPLLDFLGEGDAEARIDAYRFRLHELVDQLDIAQSLAQRRRERRLPADFSFPDPVPAGPGSDVEGSS